MLVILGAVERELLPLLEHLKQPKRISWQKRDFLKGFLFDKETVVVITGVGLVNAAYSLTLLLPFRPIDWVLVTGCAGGIPKRGLEVGGVAVATAEILAEAGAYTESGWLSLKQINLPLIQRKKGAIYHTFPVPPKAKRLFKDLPEGVRRGPFLTVSATTGSQGRLEELRRRFPRAICENMEGAAIAQICTLWRIPWFECRGISNIIGNYDKSKWQIDLASYNAAQVILSLIKEIP